MKGRPLYLNEAKFHVSVYLERSRQGQVSGM